MGLRFFVFQGWVFHPQLQNGLMLYRGALSTEAMRGIVREECSGAPFLQRSIPALRPKLTT